MRTFLLFQTTFDHDIVDTITVSMAIKYCHIIHACEWKLQAARFRKNMGLVETNNCGGAKWTSGGPLYPAIVARLKSCIGVF